MDREQNANIGDTSAVSEASVYDNTANGEK